MKNIIALLHIFSDDVNYLMSFQATARTGWVRCGVSKPESIAGHMYRMACLAFLVDKNSGLDRDRQVRSYQVMIHSSGYWGNGFKLLRP